MKYYGGWSIFELYNLPIGLRNWFFDKLSEHIKQQSEEIEKANKRR